MNRRSRADYESWREQLQVTPSADLAEISQAFLRQLERADFLPSPAVENAFQILQKTAASSTVLTSIVLTAPGEVAVREHADAVARDIEEFAGQFFDLGDVERHCRWTELRDRAEGHPSHLAQLQHLQRGLHTCRPEATGADAKVDTLVEDVCRLFVMRPADAASHRRVLRTARAAEASDWQQAARRLQARYPAIADLAPRDFEQIAGKTLSRAAAGRVSSKSMAPRMPKIAPQTKPAKANTTEKSRNLIWLLPMIVLALSHIGKFMTTKNPPRASSRPAFTSPVVPSLPVVDSPSPSSPEEAPQPRPSVAGTWFDVVTSDREMTLRLGVSSEIRAAQRPHSWYQLLFTADGYCLVDLANQEVIGVTPYKRVRGTVVNGVILRLSPEDAMARLKTEKENDLRTWQALENWAMLKILAYQAP